jgi:hypothetical protein
MADWHLHFDQGMNGFFTEVAKVATNNSPATDFRNAVDHLIGKMSCRRVCVRSAAGANIRKSVGRLTGLDNRRRSWPVARVGKLASGGAWTHRLQKQACRSLRSTGDEWVHRVEK